MFAKAAAPTLASIIALVACGGEEPQTPGNQGGQSSGGASGGPSMGGVAPTGGSTPSGGQSPSGGSLGMAGSNAGGTGGGGGAGPSGGTGGGGAGLDGGAAGSAGMAVTGGMAGTGGSMGGAPQAGSAGRPGGGAGAGGSSNTGPTFHVFVLLGQSNMAGYPRAQTADKVENERIRVLGFDDCSSTGRRADQWDVAAPPLHECFANAIGPGDYFSKTLLEKLPAGDTIGLVPCALSGQAIEIFSKGAERYDWIIDRVKNAQEMGGIVQGFLFHQGESNCGNSMWPMRVQKLVADLKADLDLGDIPFLAGELPYDSACRNHNPLVNQLPGLIPNGHVISAEGLALDANDSSRFHFGRDAQIEFGKRYEAAMVTALGW